MAGFVYIIPGFVIKYAESLIHADTLHMTAVAGIGAESPADKDLDVEVNKLYAVNSGTSGDIVITHPSDRVQNGVDIVDRAQLE